MRWVLVWVALAGPARAEMLRPGDKCLAVTFSALAEDVQAGRAEQFMADALAEADRIFASTGVPAMIPDLSREGLDGMVKLAMERCRARPADDARSVAVDVYVDVRRLQAAALAAGPTPKRKK